MTPRCVLDKLGGISVVGAVEHVEGLAEAQVPENVHGQPVAPIGHVPRGGPALVVAAAALAIPAAELAAKGANVVEDVALGLLDGAVGEGLREHTTLARMYLLVPRVVSVRDWMHKGIVELGLADIGAEPVDVLEGRVGVEGETVRAEADDRAWIVSAFALFPPSRWRLSWLQAMNYLP